MDSIFFYLWNIESKTSLCLLMVKKNRMGGISYACITIFTKEISRF